MFRRPSPIIGKNLFSTTDPYVINYKSDIYRGSVSRASNIIVRDLAGNYKIVPADELPVTDRGLLIQKPRTLYSSHPNPITPVLDIDFALSTAGSGNTRQVTLSELSGSPGVTLVTVRYFGTSPGTQYFIQLTRNTSPGEAGTVGCGNGDTLNFQGLVGWTFTSGTYTTRRFDLSTSNGIIVDTSGGFIITENRTLSRLDLSKIAITADPPTNRALPRVRVVPSSNPFDFTVSFALTNVLVNQDPSEFLYGAGANLESSFSQFLPHGDTSGNVALSNKPFYGDSVTEHIVSRGLLDDPRYLPIKSGEFAGETGLGTDGLPEGYYVSAELNLT